MALETEISTVARRTDSDHVRCPLDKKLLIFVSIVCRALGVASCEHRTS